MMYDGGDIALGTSTGNTTGCYSFIECRWRNHRASFVATQRKQLVKLVAWRLLAVLTGVIASGCVALAPGVRLTRQAADVAHCKAVGTVDAQGNSATDLRHRIQNEALGLGGNVVYLTTSVGNEGEAYQCD